MTRAASQIKRARGFTLLELIVILLLIGLAVGIAAPSIKGFFASRQTSDTALGMLAITQWCRSDAIAQGRRDRLNLGEGGLTFFVTVEKAGEFAAPDGEAGQLVTLPDGAHASFRLSPGVDALPTFIQFYPSGRSDATTVEITGKQGDVYLLTSAAPTEAYHIVTPAEGGKR
jgi:Tfp pilus assembly protein FimT